MKITEIEVNVGQTIQVKQFEPRVYSTRIKASVGEDESIDDCFTELREMANKEVRDYFVTLQGGKKPEQPVKKLNFELKPEILTQPNIPKPLHGIAPRTIMGVTWWNKTRKEVYAKTEDHCVACGVHKSEAKCKQWVEAHEYYDIDFKEGVTKILSIEPLCHYCHNFIHSGRLTALMDKEIPRERIKEILEHGFKVLSDAKLDCYEVTLDLAKEVGANTYGVKAYPTPEGIVNWSDWKLIFEGKEYKSKFKDIDEWTEFYNKENKEK